MTSRDPGRACVEEEAAMEQHGWPRVVSPLFTYLYEFTMLQAYHALGMTENAVFSLFVRELPSNRNYLVACGIGDLLEQIESFRFRDEDLAYLNSLGTFPGAFWGGLARSVSLATSMQCRRVVRFLLKSRFWR